MEEGEGEGEGVTREEVAEVRKGQKVQESLFTPLEWWGVFLQTCLGLLHLGHRPRALHLIHCAQATKKFSTGRLEMVSSFQPLNHIVERVSTFGCAVHSIYTPTQEQKLLLPCY